MSRANKISKLDLISLAVGSIIGWGAFILPGDLFLSKIGLLNSILGLLIGAGIVIVIERNYSYLIKKIPLSGGEFVFTKHSFGETHSFICGWFLSLAYICIVPLNATAIALIFNILTSYKYTFIYLYKIQEYSVYLSDVIITSVFIILLGYINIKGIKIASYFQKIMVLLLVSIISLFFILILSQEGVVTLNILTHINGNKLNLQNILKIIAISPWAYVGFDSVTQILEELNFKSRTISKISILSLLIRCLLYLVILVFTAYGVSYQEVISGNIDWATGNTIEKYFGQIGIWLLGIALISAVTCGVNGFYLNASRLISLMSKENKLPKFLSKVNEKKIPVNSIIFVMVLSLITPWIGRQILIWIVDMSSLGIAIAYLYVSLATLKIYYNENQKIKMTGILGSIFSFVFMALLIIPILESSLKIESIIILLFWILIGFIYNFYKNKKKWWKKCRYLKIIY